MSLLNSLLNQKNAKSRLNTNIDVMIASSSSSSSAAAATSYNYYNPLSYKQLLSPLTIISSSTVEKDTSYASIDRSNYSLTPVGSPSTSTCSPIGAEFTARKSLPLNFSRRAIKKTSEASSESLG
jgi:hypothetical protein